MEVVEASEGDIVAAGRVLIAPGDFHMRVGRDRRVHLDQAPSLHGVRPSVDITLDSVTEVYGRNGDRRHPHRHGPRWRGRRRTVEEAGGHVITQDEATCVVYGMPRVAREASEQRHPGADRPGRGTACKRGQGGPGR